MPARNERLCLYADPDRDGGTGRVVGFPLWWDRRAFFQQFGARQVDCSTPVDDRGAYLLYVDEAFAFDNACWAALGTPPPHLRLQREQLTADLHATKWVIVESYEWES